MKKQKARILINLLLSLTVFVVWILSFFFWRDSTLGGNGWSDLKYFTVESNLLVGVVAVIYLVYRLVKGGELPKWLSVLKYLSTAAVFVTFTVVIVFLGPMYGYGRMYYGSNLFFHLLIPLFAIAEYVIFGEEISFRESFYAVAPPVLYGIGYLTNCIENGVGSWETVKNDWYQFLEWGYGVGIVIFIVIAALAWGLGLAIRAGNRLARKIPWEDKK